MHPPIQRVFFIYVTMATLVMGVDLKQKLWVKKGKFMDGGFGYLIKMDNE